MLGFSQVDIWFYGGIAIMILAVLAGIGDIVVFGITGKKLRNKLEKEKLSEFERKKAQKELQKLSELLK